MARLPRGRRLLDPELIWLPQVNEGGRGDKREAKGRAAPCPAPSRPPLRLRESPHALPRFRNETEGQKGRFVEWLN